MLTLRALVGFHSYKAKLRDICAFFAVISFLSGYCQNRSHFPRLILSPTPKAPLSAKVPSIGNPLATRLR